VAGVLKMSRHDVNVNRFETPEIQSRKQKVTRYGKWLFIYISFSHPVITAMDLEAPRRQSAGLRNGGYILAAEAEPTGPPSARCRRGAALLQRSFCQGQPKRRACPWPPNTLHC